MPEYSSVAFLATFEAIDARLALKKQ